MYTYCADYSDTGPGAPAPAPRPSNIGPLAARPFASLSTYTPELSGRRSFRIVTLPISIGFACRILHAARETLSVSASLPPFLRSVRQDSRQFFHDVIHFGNSSGAVDQLFSGWFTCYVCNQFI
jgi:hypothetical protein